MFDYRVYFYPHREPVWILKRVLFDDAGEIVPHRCEQIEIAGSRKELAARVEKMIIALALPEEVVA